MKTVTIDMTEDAARQLLPILEKTVAEHREKANEAEIQIGRINAAFGWNTDAYATTSADPFDNLALLTAQAHKNPSGRTKKGESEKVIIGFLRARNGSGATIKEICSEASTSYATTRRILRTLEYAKKTHNNKGLWHWDGDHN